MNSSNTPLAGRVLGVSISESSELTALEFSDIPFRDAMIDFVRYMLAAGATIAYGGDLRERGFTHTLFDLVSTHRGADGTGANRIRNYLAWPIHLKLTVEQMAELKTSAEIIALPAPELPGLDPAKFLPPSDAASTYVWCLSLTHMRERLAHDNDAQILMGGRLIGSKGKYPGLAEEAYETMKARKPLFLIGAFGGCAGAVVDAVRGNRPAGLTQKEQCANAFYRDVFAYYNEHAPANEERIDYEKLVNFFNQRGIAGLHNGLSTEENERLFTTPHIPEIIALVLRGLSAVQNP